jgi:uncharacterized membrane protein YhaH (DUF805 family)
VCDAASGRFAQVWGVPDGNACLARPIVAISGWAVVFAGGAVMQWMLLPYRRYFDFSGRSRRMEFWWFLVFVELVGIAISLVFGINAWMWRPGAAMFSSTSVGIGWTLSVLFGLFNFIPQLAVSVRRLHDRNHSGWMLFIILIPLFGFIWLTVLFFLNGTPGPNRFGPDPKNPYDIDAFS